jgi:hypothetical protein
MNKLVDIEGLSEKYRTISGDELLKEYKNDDDYEVNEDTMGSKANIEPEVIKFDTESLIKSSSLPEELKKIMLNADKVEIK